MSRTADAVKLFNNLDEAKAAVPLMKKVTKKGLERNASVYVASFGDKPLSYLVAYTAGQAYAGAAKHYGVQVALAEPKPRTGPGPRKTLEEQVQAVATADPARLKKIQELLNQMLAAQQAPPTTSHDGTKKGKK
jgi:hypothetical protein